MGVPAGLLSGTGARRLRVRVKTMQDDDFEAAAVPDGGLAALLRASGVTKDSVIRITGPSGLGAVLWFCRHDYRQVGYVRPGRCRTEDGDVVFAPQRLDAEGLARLLADGPHVREGGLLVIQTAESSGQRTQAASSLLAEAGYLVEHRLTGRHRGVYVARRQAAPHCRKAA